MPPARLRSAIESRIIRKGDLAVYLSHGPTWLAKNLATLERLGMPRFIPELDGYDRVALDRWIDTISASHEPTVL